MVGHTGDIEATIVACKAADEAVKVIVGSGIIFSSLLATLLPACLEYRILLENKI